MRAPPLRFTDLSTRNETARIPAWEDVARVRLLKFITLFGFGGTEKQVAALARLLDRSRFDLSFACMKRWGYFLPEIEERSVVSEYPVRSFYRPSTLRQQLRFARRLRTEATQIVHSYNFYANVFAVPAARWAGVPCVIASIRDMGIYLTPLQQQVHRLVCGLADCVVVNAQAISDWLVEQGYRADKISVIPNGLDMSRFRQRGVDSGLRRELGLPPRAQLVMMLSRLNPQKGVEYFLQAAALVRDRCPDAYFLVVGEAHRRRKGLYERDTEYREELSRLALRLGIGSRVRFTGFRADVPELLSQAAVSVLPSLSEGLSNTLLESMAAGVPVVATRVGGTPEAVEHGEHALLVPPRDASALADAIAAMLLDHRLAERIGRQARARAEREYSLDAMVRRNENLYLGLLEHKSRERRDARAR